MAFVTFAVGLANQAARFVFFAICGGHVRRRV